VHELKLGLQQQKGRSFMKRRKTPPGECHRTDAAGLMSTGPEGCSGPGGGHGYCIWQFVKSKWVAKVQSCEPGCDCGGPPSAPGRFQGEIVQKACEKR